jgi:hypothetical protein
MRYCGLRVRACVRACVCVCVCVCSATLPAKFKIKAYCPIVFRDLRARFGEDPKAFLVRSESSCGWLLHQHGLLRVLIDPTFGSGVLRTRLAVLQESWLSGPAEVHEQSSSRARTNVYSSHDRRVSSTRA